MGDKQRTDETPRLQCEVCLKEIPASEAKSAEADDYVLYFCGLDCYSRWTAQHGTQQSPTDG